MQQVTLTIEDVKEKWRGNDRNSGEPIVLSSVKTDKGYFSTRMQGLKPGITDNFLIEEKREKSKKDQKWYDNKYIVGFANGTTATEFAPRPSAGPSPEGKELTILLDIQKKVQALYKYTFPE